MIKKVLDGRVVAVLGTSDWSSEQLWKIQPISDEESSFYCDAQGNIYRYNAKRKKMSSINPRDRGRKNLEVAIHFKNSTKNFLVKYLIALAIFPYVRFTQNRVGHLDGNLMNNKVDNIFVDITIEECDKNIY